MTDLIKELNQKMSAVNYYRTLLDLIRSGIWSQYNKLPEATREDLFNKLLFVLNMDLNDEARDCIKIVLGKKEYE